MDNKKTMQDRKKANRLLYIVIVSVLCITALVIGITAAFNRRGETEEPKDSNSSPVEDTDSPTESTPPVNEPTDGTAEPDDAEVVLLAPLAGAVSKGHSLDVLVYSLTMNDYRVHQGIDIATSVGSGVYAAAAGTVPRVWEDPMMGTCVSIDHGKGIVTVYKNLAEDVAEGIEEGAAVSSAQLIGAVGETAIIELADEPHLHFEVTVDGTAVDPLSMLSEGSIETGLSGEDVFED